VNVGLKYFTTLLALFLFAMTSWAQKYDWSEVPKAVTDPRVDAPYGTFGSVVGVQARGLQAELESIEARIHSVPSFLSSLSSEKASEKLYLMEVDLLARVQEISLRSDQLSSFERESLEGQAIRLYRYLRTFSERYYQDMIRYIDVRLPGPNGLQIRQDFEKNSLYSPNYRRDVLLSQQEMDIEYNKKLQDFLAKGGDLREIFTLNEKTILALGLFSRFEYVVTPNHKIRITSGNAGHILLGQGQEVLTAGQIMILKNRAGDVVMAVITNASGSYKPDMTSAQNFAERFATRFKIPMSRIVLTMGEPLSTQSFKIYLKANGLPEDEIKMQSKALEQNQKVLTTLQSGPQKCKAAHLLPYAI
jgi:hypothetical protein